MKQKPTLDELFQSKKLDLPEDDFWNGFQDRVKGKTMAALSQQTKTAKARRAGLYGVVPVMVLALVGWSMFNFNGVSTEGIAVTSESTNLFEASYNELSTVMEGDFSIEREGAIQLARLDSFDSFANARIQIAGGDEKFNFHTLSLSKTSSPSPQYTF